MNDRTKRLGVAIALLGTALLGSACGGGDAKDATATSAPPAPAGGDSSSGDDGASGAKPVKLDVEACSLFTDAEIADAIGGSVTSQPYSNGTVCRWFGDTGFVQASVSPITCELLFAALDQNLQGGGQRIVTDVGDGALVIEGASNIQVRAAGGCFDVEAGDSNFEPVSDDIVLDLARLAVTRIV